MATISRVRALFSGLPGGAGVATFYGLDPLVLRPSVRTLWTALIGYMPVGLHIAVETAGDTFEDTTGELTGNWSTSGEADLVSEAAGNYSAPSGLLIRWATQTVVDGKRLKGRTFVVPIVVGGYDAAGTLLSTYITGAENAAAAFVTAQDANAVIWHRPRVARAASGSRPAVTARAGGHGLITGSSVPDKAVILRSRRD